MLYSVIYAKVVRHIYDVTEKFLNHIPYSDASLAPSVTLLAPHFKSILQLAVAYRGVLHKKL